MIFKKIIKYLFVILTVMNITWAAHAYYDKTHSLVAKFAIELVKKFDMARKIPLYKEIYDPSHVIQLGKGAWEEDHGAVAGNDRSLRHYYDPDETRERKGVAYYWYYHFWRFKGGEVTYPGSYHYLGALEWARKGTDRKKEWSSENPYNWEGAIRAYDYTPSSRNEAYYRLGHVVHLLADMAEPDHAFNVPHPGSGYKLPDDLNEICGPPLVEKIINSSIHQEKSKRNWALLLLGMYWKLMNKIRQGTTKDGPKFRTFGFEGLIEDGIDPGLVEEFFDDKKYLTKSEFPLDTLPPIAGKEIRRRETLDDYFNILARRSKEAVKDKKKFPLALGCHHVQKYVGGIWPVPIYIIPAIDMYNEKEREKYRNLAWKLLSLATEYSAGILEHFHAIVNPPPYVKAVTVKQNNENKYHAYWEDNTYLKYIKEIPNKPHLNYKIVPHRLFKVKENSHLEPDKEAIIEIEFGPDCCGYPEPVDNIDVLIGSAHASRKLQRDDTRTVWIGSFTVPSLNSSEIEKELQIKISAEDIHTHYDPKLKTFVKGFKLDSDPKSPAKVNFIPLNGYRWDKYEDGVDKKHKVKVKKLEEDPFVGWWKGTYSGSEHIKKPINGLELDQWENLSISINIRKKGDRYEIIVPFNFQWALMSVSVSGSTMAIKGKDVIRENWVGFAPPSTECDRSIKGDNMTITLTLKEGDRVLEGTWREDYCKSDPYVYMKDHRVWATGTIRLTKY